MRNKVALTIIASALLFCALLFTATTSTHTFAASRNTAEAAHPAIYPYGCPQAIQLGSQGYTVIMLQNRLNLAGYTIPVNGYFGLDTMVAVKNFQISYGLPPTGAVDPMTWHFLNAC